MRKIKLDLDALDVDSFATLDSASARGTVVPHSGAWTCPDNCTLRTACFGDSCEGSCGGDTCYALCVSGGFTCNCDTAATQPYASCLVSCGPCADTKYGETCEGCCA